MITKRYLSELQEFYNSSDFIDEIIKLIDKEKKECLEQFVSDYLQICSKIDKDMGLDYVNVVIDIIKLQLKKYIGERL